MAADSDEIVGYVHCPNCLDAAGPDGDFEADYGIGLTRDGRHIVAMCMEHGAFKAFELATPLHWHCSAPDCGHGTRGHDDG